MKGQFCFSFCTLSSQCIHFHSRKSPRWSFTLNVLKAGTFSFLSKKQCEKQSWDWGSDPVGCRYPDNSANAHIETRASGAVCVPLAPEFVWSKPLLCGWWYRWLLVFSGVTAREKREECKSFHQRQLIRWIYSKHVFSLWWGMRITRSKTSQHHYQEFLGSSYFCVVMKWWKCTWTTGNSEEQQ